MFSDYISDDIQQLSVTLMESFTITTITLHYTTQHKQTHTTKTTTTTTTELRTLPTTEVRAAAAAACCENLLLQTTTLSLKLQPLRGDFGFIIFRDSKLPRFSGKITHPKTSPSVASAATSTVAKMSSGNCWGQLRANKRTVILAVVGTVYLAIGALTFWALELSEEKSTRSILKNITDSYM